MSGQTRVRAVALLEGGFLVCSGKENPDSDAHLDVDGDDSRQYGEPRYTEADVIPCPGKEPGHALGTPGPAEVASSGWAGDAEMPSSNRESSKPKVAVQETCRDCDTGEVTEASAAITLEALKAHVRELERQLSRGHPHKCLICMDAYTEPLTSTRCWHVHCEGCWLRTLGAKKLCPQCNAIMAPGDLRHIHL